MDSFFASIEMREKPELTGKPVVVGADPKGGKGRGVVSTCSYEARKYGIRSGMPISRAYKLCPTAVFLPVNFPLYIKTSGEVMNILRSFAEKFQQVSIDEAYLDVSNIGGFEAARELALRIKNEILEKEKLTCSIGAGPNKIVAKIASDYKKPEGLTIVEPSHVREFFSSLPVRKILGIGKKTEAELKELRINTVGQLAAFDVQLLISRFGKWGIYMHELAQGIDESVVSEEECCKSISREITFEDDTDNVELLNRTMEELTEDVHRSLLDEGFLFKTLTIKVRYKGFITRTRAHTLSHYTDDIGTIKDTSKALLKQFIDGKMSGLLEYGFPDLKKGQGRNRW